MAGIYLHIPFCKQACYYCDFHFSTDTKHRSELLEAMNKEIVLQNNYLQGETIESVYFGGGTPSICTLSDLERLMGTINSQFQISAGAEFTLEANPDDLSQEKLVGLRSLGVNRLSIGIQTFDDKLLGFLHRAHRSDEAQQSVMAARKAGFDNISIDLIYGIPGLTIEGWRENIQKALELAPEHLSAYALTIEEKTVFGHQLKTGKFSLVEEETVAIQFELLMDEMEKAGYLHYEISNFSKPGKLARHNSNYWRQDHYLGIGPSAHSFQGDSRQFNVKNNVLYTRAVLENKVPFEREILTLNNKINEYVLTSLRTSWGLDTSFLKEVLNDDLVHRAEINLARLLDLGLVEWKEKALLLTRKGKLLADRICEELMIIEG